MIFLMCSHTAVDLCHKYILFNTFLWKKYLPLSLMSVPLQRQKKKDNL